MFGVALLGLSMVFGFTGYSLVYEQLAYWGATVATNLAAGSLAEHGFEHVTKPISRFRTFPATMPVGSLDKIYLRGKIRVKRAHIVRSKLAKAASDHLPLVADLQFTR